MWRILDKGRESLRQKLAQLAGCDTEELVINRNTTEALATIIFGLPLQKGDEVVLSQFDYPNMKQAWLQREAREGIKLKWVDLKMPIEDDQVAVDAYKKQITSKTKLVHITHVINWTGQIMPVKKVADLAHSYGAEVLIDGAHSFAHLNFKISDLGAEWETKTKSPIALGGIVASNRIPKSIMQQIDQLIAKSVADAFDKYPAISDYVSCHAQEMSEAVMRQHIDLYVNDFSADMGETGKNAIETLVHIYQQMNATTSPTQPSHSTPASVVPFLPKSV